MQLAIHRLICLLTVLSAAASQAQPDDLMVSSPYAAISKRNVFDLKPFVPPPVEQPKPVEQPASVVLVGAKDHQGVRTAILTVQQAPKPGQLPSAKTLTIKQGETQGPITVVNIANVKTGEMEIVNNGTTMKIDFKSHAGKLAAPTAPNLPPGFVAPIAGMPPALPGGAGGVPQPFVPPNARNLGAVPGSDPAAMGATVRPMRASATASYGYGGGGMGVVNAGAQPAPQQPAAVEHQYSREAQAIAIEIERRRTENAVRMGQMPPLPPTELSPQEPQ